MRVAPVAVVLPLIILSAAAAGLAGNTAPEKIRVEGRIVCADSLGVRISAQNNCPPPARYALSDDQGKVYFFASTDARADILKDPRVRQRRLRLNAQVKPSGEIEIVKLQSVKDGRVYDVYYRCETCNITAYAAGPCPCCQDELEFRETPAEN